ncbi:BRO family protein [Mycobacterium sp.]|uniref:BRO family protein n=1 Tax=Mycobacterium sp. TaxID=1785 RepID=UPI002C90ACCC|nr:BRO family protein [Mycobacterium sp.]HKP44438.1 BRO family protein [Mycobacterium sp.]
MTGINVPERASAYWDALDRTRPNEASPFDALRRCTPEGREYWSGRDLMPPLGYDSWRRFADAVHRAKIAAQNSGYDVTSLFAGAVKKTDGRPAEDYHLARYACYLIAMNGDPRKPEIAAAQTYFAIKTREAETAPARELKGPQLVAAALIEAHAMLEAKDARIAELEPSATAWDRLGDLGADYEVADVLVRVLGAAMPFAL